MNTLALAKTKTLEMLASRVDGPAAANGFKRANRSFDYKRDAGEVRWGIHVGVQRPNNSAPDVEGLIQVMVDLSLPAIAPTVLVLGGGKRWAPDPPERLFLVPLGRLAPDEQARWWRPVDAKGWEACGKELASTLIEIVVPMCDSYGSLVDVAKGLESGDRRLASLDDGWPVRATATAFVAEGRASAERMVSIALGSKYGKEWPKLRERLASL